MRPYQNRHEVSAAGCVHACGLQKGISLLSAYPERLACFDDFCCRPAPQMEGHAVVGMSGAPPVPFFCRVLRLLRANAILETSVKLAVRKQQRHRWLTNGWFSAGGRFVVHSATDGTPAAPCIGASPAPRLQLIRLDCAAWKVQIRCRSLHISHNYVHRSFGM